MFKKALQVTVLVAFLIGGAVMAEDTICESEYQDCKSSCESNAECLADCDYFKKVCDEETKALESKAGE